MRKKTLHMNSLYESHEMADSECTFFQVDEVKVDIVKQRPGLLEEKSRLKSCGEVKVWRRGEGDHHVPQNDVTKPKEKSILKNGGSSSQGDDDNLSVRWYRSTENKSSYPTEKRDADLKAERLNNTSLGKILDKSAHDTYLRTNNSISDPRKTESKEALFREKTNFAPSYVEQLGKTENAFSSHKYSNNSALDSMRKEVDEGSDRLKSSSSYALPPPYTKSNHGATPPPYVKPKGDIQKLSAASKAESDHHHCEEKLLAPASVKSYGHEKELNHQDERIPLPKPRSIRRKHHKSSSSNNAVDTHEDAKAVNRSSSSRRKDHSKKGLQILFDEEHHIKDDEERMIDKLLIHYSKKPSSFDAGKLKKKSSHHVIGGGESSFDNVHDSKYEAFPTPARSVSLPHEQGAAADSPEVKKVFTRSITFQPDNQAKHVHPKLPDYDDLAARFAALKGR